MQKIFKKIKEVKQSFLNFFKINPHRHWILLLYIFLSLAIVLIVFSLYFLYEIKNEQLFKVSIPVPNKNDLLKDSLLKNTIKSFDIKAEKESAIMNSQPLYKDPSI